MIKAALERAAFIVPGPVASRGCLNAAPQFYT